MHTSSAFGANIAHWTSLSQANVRSPGQFTFNGTITGLPLADFLTGSLAQLIQATPNSLDMRQLYLGLYAQDTWKMSSKATLNYGVRWEPGLAQQIQNGAIYNFSVDRFLAGTKTTRVRERAARVPLSRRPGLHQRPGGHGETTGGSSLRASASPGIPGATAACRSARATRSRTTS